MITKDGDTIKKIKVDYYNNKLINLTRRINDDKKIKEVLPENNLMNECLLTLDLYEKILKEEDLIYYDCKGYPCIIGRSYCTGVLNGYIGIIKKASFLVYMDYDNISSYLDVHGGFTFADFGGQEIWYKYDDQGNELFWIGFDVGHSGDFIPYFKTFRGTYKDRCKCCKR